MFLVQDPNLHTKHGKADQSTNSLKHVEHGLESLETEIE